MLNNKVYFGSDSYNDNVYEYDPATNTSKIVIWAKNLVKSSGVVLNNKLYFGSYSGNVWEYDPATDTSKIVIQTGIGVESSGVVLNNKVYFGSTDIMFMNMIHIELIESDIIFMKDHIIRGLYIEYKKQHPNDKIKNISNINLENLTVFDLSLEEIQKNKSSNSEQDIKDFCKICINV